MSGARADAWLAGAVRALTLLFAFSLPVGIAFTQITLLVAIAAWLVRCIAARRWPLHATPLDGWIGLFLAASIVATLFSVRPAESAVALKKFYLVTPAYLLAYAVTDLRHLRMVIASFLLGAALTAGWGLVRYAAGIDPRLLGTQTMALTSGGIYMMAGLLSLSMLWSALDRRSHAGLAAAAALLITAGLVLTKAVSSWLGWLAGSLAFIRGRRRAAAAASIAVAVLLVCLVSFRSSSAEFLTVDKAGSWQVRVNLWRLGWQLFQDRPLTGHGLLSLQGFYRGIPYDNPYWHEAIQTGHMHNNFIQVAVTTGLLGLVAFLAMWGAIIGVMFRALSATPGGRPYALGALGCVVGFLVNGMAEYNYGDSEVVTVLWMAVGLALALCRMRPGLPCGCGGAPIPSAPAGRQDCGHLV